MALHPPIPLGKPAPSAGIRPASCSPFRQVRASPGFLRSSITKRWARRAWSSRRGCAYRRRVLREIRGLCRGMMPRVVFRLSARAPPRRRQNKQATALFTVTGNQAYQKNPPVSIYMRPPQSSTNQPRAVATPRHDDNCRNFVSVISHQNTTNARATRFAGIVARPSKTRVETSLFSDNICCYVSSKKPNAGATLPA